MSSYREIAQIAGVSLATVSLALRGRPGVSGKTRARIQKIAAKCEYRENPLITALMTQQRTRRKKVRAILALLTEIPMDDFLHSNPAEIYRGALSVAREHGFVLETMTWSSFQENTSRLAMALRTRCVPGVLFHGPIPDWCSFDWSSLALVSCGWKLQDLPVDFAGADSSTNMATTLDNLEALGCRRTGFLFVKPDYRLSDDPRRPFAYFGWHGYRGRQAIPCLHLPSWDAAAFLEWIRRHRMDTVISNIHPTLILHAVQKAGYRVPEEMRYAHLSLDKRWRGLCGIEENNFDVGAEAVRILIDRINTNSYGLPLHPRSVLIKGDWVPGDRIDMASLAPHKTD